MTRSLERPTLAGVISRGKERDTDLERKLGAQANGPAAPAEFDHPGRLTVAESDPWVFHDRRSFSLITVALDVPSSSGSVTFDLKIDGTVRKSIEIPEGATIRQVPCAITGSPLQTMTCDITDNATDAAGLMVKAT